MISFRQSSLRAGFCGVSTVCDAETHEEYTVGVSDFAAAVYSLRNTPVATMVIADLARAAGA